MRRQTPNQTVCASTLRYPAGESYMDVIQRLEPVIIEMEREKECVCIVGHQAILRALYGYFTNKSLAVRVPNELLLSVWRKRGGVRGCGGEAKSACAS